MSFDRDLSTKISCKYISNGGWFKLTDNEPLFKDTVKKISFSG